MVDSESPQNVDPIPEYGISELFSSLSVKLARASNDDPGRCVLYGFCTTCSSALKTDGVIYSVPFPQLRATDKFANGDD